MVAISSRVPMCYTHIYALVDGFFCHHSFVIALFVVTACFVSQYHVSNMTESGPLFTKRTDVSWNLEAMRLDAIMSVSLWNQTGISAALLLKCLSNFQAIRQVQVRISRLRGFAKSCCKTSVRSVNRGPGSENVKTENVTLAMRRLP